MWIPEIDGDGQEITLSTLESKSSASEESNLKIGIYAKQQ